MVGAGVVNHPSEWPFCGYHEIQDPHQRYSLIDFNRLIPLLQMRNFEDLQKSCRKRVDQAITEMDQNRDSKWTESIAVGSERFIEATKRLLGIKAKGRKVIGGQKSFELREPAVSYGVNFTLEKGHLSLQNCYF